MKNTLITIAACLVAGHATATTVLHNVRGYTPTDEGLAEFTVLVIDEDGRVAATGGDALLESYENATIIDGMQLTVLPGLTDSHAHLFGLGDLTMTLNLTGVDSLETAIDRVADYAAARRSLPWIIGRGWNQVLWPVREFPTASDLDKVVSDRPVWLDRIDGHAGWANSKALEMAGIDADTPDPVGGKIVRDDNGRATGVLVDKAMSLVTQHIPAPDKAYARQAYRTATEELLSLGITGMHDAGINLMQAEVLMSMADNDELPIRVYAMLSSDEALIEEIGEPIRGYGNEHLDIASVKIYSDGALGSRGAALLEPYSDDPENTGLPFWTPDELEQQVKFANSRGFQAAVHAIGDRSIRMVLDAYESAQGGDPSSLRNRVEHVQIVAPTDFPRFAELGVIASIQGVFATSDMNMAEDRVGAERIKGSYAWRRLLDSGARIANGSDFPVELPNPFHGLYATVTREDRDGLPEGGWLPDQVLTREEALHSFTLGSAYAAHRENTLGSLEAGKWADFIVIDRDYFEIPASEIDDIRVLQTWVGGKLMYSHGDEQ
ncbi:MAG: amidohydrolase [Woeseiaceae bacterium]|nr:amidohydrolase [Woeseiaceae bacterium]